MVTLGGDTLQGHTLTLLVRFFRKVTCVVLATGVRMVLCMDADEARGVCKDRSKWHSLVSAYPHEKKALVYVCMNVCICMLYK